MNLHDIQTKVRVAKDKRNDFGGYNYRTAEGILAALKAELPDGATVIVSDTLQELAGKIFVTATATIKLATGEEYSAQGHAMHALTKKGMDEAQITGSASSYARKYALSGLLAIDDGSVDPDAGKPPEEEPKPEKTDAEKRDWFKTQIEGASKTDALDKWWKGENISAGIAALPEPMRNELQKAYTDRMGALS